MYETIIPIIENTATITAHHPILTISYITLIQSILYVNLSVSTIYRQSEDTINPSIELDTTLLKSETAY